MKRFLAIALALVMVLGLAACGGSGADTKKSDGVMTYAEYMAAAIDDQVVIEAYVQGAQAYSAEYGNTSLYLQDADGGYFVYRIACTESEYKQFTTGAKLKITGYKSEWAGEVEIVDATFEVEKGSYTAKAVDVTSQLGTDALQNSMNTLVSFKGLTVEAADDSGAAYLYNWDGSGTQGDDLYFNVSLNGQTYSFTVESDLCDSSTAVYKAVEGLSVGDTVDLEGFLYWYEGPNPHITGVTLAN